MTTTVPIYAPGDSVLLRCDLFPARISPLPAGVPEGQKIRVVVTERALTVLSSVGRVDIEMTPEETAGVTYIGGMAGAYQVSRAGGCGCGAKALSGINPWPGVTYVQPGRVSKTSSAYGVPPTRWSRSR